MKLPNAREIAECELLGFIWMHQWNRDLLMCSVVGLAKSVAQDYAHLNLRANAIGPGVIETPMTNDVLVDENVKNHLLTRIPLKRVAQASEVASLVYFLATDESSYITGTYIPIDGGYLSS